MTLKLINGVGHPELAAEPPMPRAAPIAVRASPEAFEAIYRAQIGYVWRVLRHFCVPERDIEDVAHDVFAAAYSKLATFDASRAVRPWLTGIAFRVASNHRRRASNRREVQAPAAVEEARGRGDDPERQTMQNLLVRALGRLEPERRAVVVLHEIFGFTMPEIAEMTSTPLNTAYSRLRLARRQLTANVARLRIAGEGQRR